MIRIALFTGLIGLLWLEGFGLSTAQLGAQPPRVVEVREERRFAGHTSSVYRVTFTPDGKSALSCSFDQTVRRWDVATGKQTDSYLVNLTNDIAVFSDGSHALFARGQSLGTQRITLWNLDKAEEVVNWRGHEMAIKHVRLLPNGKSAVTASGDGTAILWDLELGKPLHEFVAWRQGVGDNLPPGLPRQAGNVAIAVSPDGKFLATGTARNNMIAVWDLGNGKEIRSWPSGHGEVSSIAYSPDGKYLLTATINGLDTGAQLWETSSGKLVREWLIGPQLAACLSPNGKRFLTAGTKGDIRLWIVEGQIPLRRFVGHEGWVNNVTFSPDGKTALSAGDDMSVRLWSMPD